MELDTETFELIFQEAYSHCRWKKVFIRFLKGAKLEEKLEYYKNMSFGEIFNHIYSLLENTRGLGVLVAYDIAAGICKHHSIVIDKVYIMGNGPKRAAKILGLKLKSQLGLRYVEIVEVIEAFDKHRFVMDDYMRANKDGDALESYLCKWQSKVRTGCF